MRYVIGLSFTALAFWILQATGALTAIFVFLMVGAVPGTSISVSPMSMLFILILLATILGFWAARHPLHEIKRMRQAYHTQPEITLALTAAKPTPKPVSHDLRNGFDTGYARSVHATYNLRHRIGANLRRGAVATWRRFAKIVRPIRLAVLALLIAVTFASRELATWAEPHLQRSAIWLRKQAIYSVKGTMLSAHRWSSLSKKALSSARSLLNRCNSALKRGKSLLTRDAR
jgi:hypothetical protein